MVEWIVVVLLLLVLWNQRRNRIKAYDAFVALNSNLGRVEGQGNVQQLELEDLRRLTEAGGQVNVLVVSKEDMDAGTVS